MHLNKSLTKKISYYNTSIDLQKNIVYKDDIHSTTTKKRNK